MKSLGILGIVLILAGIAGLFLGRVSWTETEPLVKAGPFQINTQEDHTIWLPTAAGIATVIAGVGLVFVSRRQA
jgi:hypothetical protein